MSSPLSTTDSEDFDDVPETAWARFTSKVRSYMGPVKSFLGPAIGLYFVTSLPLLYGESTGSLYSFYHVLYDLLNLRKEITGGGDGDTVTVGE